MKKSLFFWMNRDKTSGGGSVWIDIPETEADRKQLDERKARLMNNPIAKRELEDLKHLGFRWIHSASPNQFDGFSEDDDECCDRARVQIGGSQ